VTKCGGDNKWKQPIGGGKHQLQPFMVTKAATNHSQHSNFSSFSKYLFGNIQVEQ